MAASFIARQGHRRRSGGARKLAGTGVAPGGGEAIYARPCMFSQRLDVENIQGCVELTSPVITAGGETGQSPRRRDQDGDRAAEDSRPGGRAVWPPSEKDAKSAQNLGQLPHL
jgi:hypothetical protein